ncbi:SGNH/GDSL hydrolase family protein [Sphingomonas oryzagri]
MSRVGTGWLTAAVAVLGLTAAQAQTKVDGDPAANDPVGIVADPCPVRPKPADEAGWRMWNLHMLTRDFGQVCRYHAANAALVASRQPVRVVFMGDSITDNWQSLDTTMFAGGLVDRGISGQTTPQMLVRFREDVIALHPQAVHIMAGTNDIAGNTGAETLAFVQGNIETMAELAKLHGIKVILASIPPAAAFPWSPGKQPAPQIVAFNAWLRDYAAHNGFTYLDYHAALADAQGGMKPGLSSDGVHPTAEGYAIMRPLALAAIAKTLGR